MILQVRQVGKEFYNTDIKCGEMSVDDTHGASYCQMRLTFDNSQSCAPKSRPDSAPKVDNLEMTISPDDFFSLFPFHMVLNR